MSERWERIYAIFDYYDGPALGVADLDGRPHIFQRTNDDKPDDWEPHYLVQPADDETLRIVQEQAAISERWRTALHRGETTRATFPALAPERARYDQLLDQLRDRLVVDESAPQWDAEFKGEEQVCWRPLGSAPLK